MDYNFDPELEKILEFLPDRSQSIGDPAEARAAFKEMIGKLNKDLNKDEVIIRDLQIPGPEGAPDVPIRICSPEGLDQDVPGLLHIHGGGFVVGDLDSELGTAVKISRQLGVVVVSPDYRLAPETPYPGALEDCYATLEWMFRNSAELQIDTSRLAVSGMSAGGGLAAATSLLSRDRSGPKLCFQYLGIPELDDRLDTPSMKRFVDTPMWNRPNAELSWDYYLGDKYKRGDAAVPYLAAPARAEDLSNLPPSYVSTMEFDPLRDEGILYALKMMQAGIRTELHSFPGTFHGSAAFDDAQISRREKTEMFAVLKRGLQIED